MLKIDRSPQKYLMRATKRALLAQGRGYIQSFGGTRQELIEKEQQSEVPKDYALPKGVKSQRKKSVVFKR